ncbi:MAG TPA: HAMP domain-containing sensor histidine kinase [Jatrophihabitans sp.]
MAARQTLQTRLILLLTGLLLIGCAAVGVATTLVLRSFMTEGLDEQLNLAGSRYAVALEHNDNDADNPETSTIGQPVGTLGARVMHGAVTSIGVVSEPNRPASITAADRSIVATMTPLAGNRTVEFPDLGKYRVHVSSGQDGDVLVTGLPQHPVDETLHHIVYAELVVFLIVVVVVGLIGTVAVRRSLKPLSRVAATALRVSELPLATGDGRLPERVPAADERTEVGQVSSAVNQMLSRIESALTERQRSEERLRQFVADASHDLRTPLAIVRSHTELIQQDSSELPDAVGSSLERIESATIRMSRLVDDLLLLARLDSGTELRHDEVDLSRIAIDSVADAGVAGPDHRWSLELGDEPVVVVGDEDRLHQVIANLLTNARIHTPAGTAVVVQVTQTDGGGAELTVTDDGPGIPADLLPRVRERFVRGDTARSAVRGGSGLGLAIAAAVVAAHRGVLDIQSKPGHTRIAIRLPGHDQHL